MRFLKSATCTLFAVLMATALLLSGCGTKPATSSTPKATTTAAGNGDETTSGDTQETEETTIGTEDTGSTTSSGDSGKTNSVNTTKAPTKAPTTVSTGTNTNFVSGTDAEKWGTEKGLTSTKKVPDWMKTIPNGKLLTLGSSKADAETLEYQKTVFKALTGKELEIEEKIVEWNALRSQLQTMVLSGQGPDIFGIYNGVGIYLRNKGLTRNIKEYINMNDAAWEGMKAASEVMLYKGELTGVTTADALITGGIIYNKTLIKQAGLDDPWDLYEQKKWNITTFLDYVEELTVDENHDNKPEVFGVSMAPESLFRFSLASGEDLVKFNADGTVSNNIRSATFTRWASYARQIEKMGSYDTESWTAGQRFIQGKVAMWGGQNIWNMFSSKDMIQMKKQDKIGWVPQPLDVNAKTHYHSAEQTYYFMPKNSKNPKGAAAYLYMQRYSQLNPSADKIQKEKTKYINEYGWTAEEYEFQRNFSDHLTPVTFNWVHLPDFKYQSLWNVFTEDWSKLVEEVNPSLQAAINNQNK